MKKLIIFLLLFCSLLTFGQTTPAKIVRVSTAASTFTDNIPKGAIIINTGTGDTYLTLLPLVGSKTIATCTLNTDITKFSTNVSDASTYVPYTGANANVNLGTWDLTADIITGNSFTGVKNALNSVTTNLGNPTVEEEALLQGEMSNKLRWISPILQEESVDGTTWTSSTRATANNLADMMIGEGQGTSFAAIPAQSIGVPGAAYRLTWDSSVSGYIFLNRLYVYCATESNIITFKIEARDYTLQTWSTIAIGTANSWPGHVFIPHTSVAFLNSAGRVDQVRISMQITTVNTTNPFILCSIEWFGAYPQGRRNVESYDHNKNTYWPAGGSFASTLESSSTITGSLTTPGGIGVGKASYFGDNILLAKGGTELRIGEDGIGSGAVLGSKISTDGSIGSTTDYGMYIAYDTYYNEATAAWVPMRATLGGKWKYSMGYNTGNAKWSYSTAYAPISWTDVMTLGNSGNLTMTGTCNTSGLLLGGTATFLNWTKTGSCGSAGQMLIGAGVSASPIWVNPNTITLSSFSNDISSLYRLSSWLPPNDHVAASVTTGTGLGISTQNITMATANSTTQGTITAADWNTFNGKQNALGFTPYNSINPNLYIPLTALSSTATGLTYTNTTGVFSLTSGYGIPTTTQIGNIHAPGSDNQTLTIAGTTSPTIALSGSNTATFAGAGTVSLNQTGGTITITGASGSQSLSTANTISSPVVTTLSGSGGSFTLAAGGYTSLSAASNVITITSNGDGTGIPYPTGSGIPIVSTGSSWGTTITDNSTNWNKYNQWDGGSTGLIAATGRASLGLGPIATIPDTYNVISALATLTGAGGFAKFNGTSWSEDNNTYSLSSHNHAGVYEPVLGNPASNGYVLSSTTAGVRSWVAPTSYSLPVATTGSLGGVALNFTASGASVPLQISGNNAFVTITAVAARTNLDAVYVPYSGANANVALGSYTVTAGNFILNSDRRLKQNIKPLDFPGVSKIKFVEFTIKSDTSNRKRYGVIAQDVEKIAPELVYTDKEGIKSVAYIDLIIVKLAQLQAKIDNLESQVTYLTARDIKSHLNQSKLTINEKNYKKEFDEANKAFDREYGITPCRAK
jgi:hypothetical protein